MTWSLDGAGERETERPGQGVIVGDRARDMHGVQAAAGQLARHGPARGDRLARKHGSHDGRPVVNWRPWVFEAAARLSGMELHEAGPARCDIEDASPMKS
ncbi:MAG: hypothetical protein ABI434_20170 [Burkholderiaceae bacterium]